MNPLTFQGSPKPCSPFVHQGASVRPNKLNEGLCERRREDGERGRCVVDALSNCAKNNRKVMVVEMVG